MGARGRSRGGIPAPVAWCGREPPQSMTTHTIRTRYHGPTAHLPARIRAWGANLGSITQRNPGAGSEEDGHATAALALLREAGRARGVLTSSPIPPAKPGGRASGDWVHILTPEEGGKP